MPWAIAGAGKLLVAPIAAPPSSTSRRVVTVSPATPEPAAWYRGSRSPTARPSPSHRRETPCSCRRPCGSGILGGGVGEDPFAELAERFDELVAKAPQFD